MLSYTIAELEKKNLSIGASLGNIMCVPNMYCLLTKERNVTMIT